LFILIRKK